MNILRQTTVMALAFFFVGVGLLVGAAYQFFGVRSFVRTAISVPGRVVDLEYQSGLGGRSSGGFKTVFTFSDASGVTHTGRTSSAQNPATHDIGEEVVVLYRSGSVKDARIRSFRTLWILPTFLGVFGAAFSVIGALAYVSARRTYGPTA
jgi:hypothetical protein